MVPLDRSSIDGRYVTTVVLTQDQIEIACGNGETKLPAGITAPASWPCGDG